MQIKIFTTGGSLDKYYDTAASNFIVGPPVVQHILQEVGIQLDVACEELCRKDSLALTPADLLYIVARVKTESLKHIIITHGTDTMANTARALGSMEDKVVVFTGAMQPAAFKQSDAYFNLGCALAAVQILPPGVYLAMNGRIFNPHNVRKNLAENRFEDTV